MSLWNRGGFQWEEKNLTSWTKKFLEESFKSYEIKEEEIELAVTEVVVDGFSIQNMRKGKKICAWDMKVTLTLKGKAHDEDIEATFKFTDVSEGVEDADDYEFTIDVKKPAPGTEVNKATREILKKTGKTVFIGKMLEWYKAYRAK
ncbi:Activator of 90kDa heat shock protein ATPase-like protein [Aduncisulcus paluster]|uniref:Activator of 90kDa heat shock protein ATPase-like protein n=1 Tax=Aduncisulcus paluster TaxID=2918883 RepID=A0ABQ5JZS1_9EUKA|nr:Activator of 90kDa heat shock protein ATPase-like protein [Aduncisulcus paluster]